MVAPAAAEIPRSRTPGRTPARTSARKMPSLPAPCCIVRLLVGPLVGGMVALTVPARADDPASGQGWPPPVSAAVPADPDPARPACLSVRLFGQSLRQTKACRSFSRPAGDPRGAVCLDGLWGEGTTVTQGLLNAYCRSVEAGMRAAVADLDGYVRNQAALLVTLGFASPGGDFADLVAAEWRAPTGPLATLLTTQAHAAFLAVRFRASAVPSAAGPAGTTLERPYRASEDGAPEVMALVDGTPILEVRDTDQGTEAAMRSRVVLIAGEAETPARQLVVAAKGRFLADAATDLNPLGLLWEVVRWEEAPPSGGGR